MGKASQIAQPLVVAFAVALWILHNGIAVLDAEGVVQPPHGFCAAPKVSEFAVTVQIDGADDNVVVDVMFICMSADDKSVFALGEAHGQLPAQPVCFLRRDLAGDEGLAQMVGDHIVFSSHSAGFLDVELLCEPKFFVCDPGIASEAGDKLALFGLFRVFNVIDDVADGCPDASALTDVQRHQAGGGQSCTSCSFRDMESVFIIRGLIKFWI